MRSCPYQTLMRYRAWATKGLYDAVWEHIGRLAMPDRTLIMQLLDHIHRVDDIFRHNLQARAHDLAPTSAELPTFETLAREAMLLSMWYVDFADRITSEQLGEQVAFRFANGAPATMTRGDMLLHVSTHGSYHRGNVGILLQKNGIEPFPDRMTDFLVRADTAADWAAPRSLVAGERNV